MKTTRSKAVIVTVLLLTAAVLIYVREQHRTAAQQVIQTIPPRPTRMIPGSSSHTSTKLERKAQSATNLTADNWGAQFRKSADYFEFVTSAVQAAIHGDGRAAFYISATLGKCGDIIIKAHRLKKSKADFERDFIEEYDRIGSYAPQWAKDERITRLHQCTRLEQEDAFVSLPNIEGGYQYKYWHDLALTDGDPLAEANQAAPDSLNISEIKSNDEKNAALGRVQSYVRDAVVSKDPETIFSIGMTLANGSVSQIPLRGIAMSLAACDLGYDCSANNPQNYWHNCEASAMCSKDTTFADFVQQSLGSEEYAQAQEFKEQLGREDWAGLEKYTKLNGQFKAVN